MPDAVPLRLIREMNSIVIAPEEQFPVLTHAPVIEAVLELRCRRDSLWEESAVTTMLKEHLPDFSIESLAGTKMEWKVQLGQEPEHSSEELGWVGVLMRTADKKEIVRVERDMVVFSQLAPYPGWDVFSNRAIRYWGVVAPDDVSCEFARIGMRYINRIELTGPTVDLEEYLVAAPKLPLDLELPFVDFLHRETIGVPGYDYVVQLTRTIQQTETEQGRGLGLIIDIDVATTKPWSGTLVELHARLNEMRWLKNKTFFGSLTQNAKSLLA